jgi:hypothetical protein
MKLCPNCSAELRDSVIKCRHCGQSLREAAEPAPAASNTPSPGPLGPPSKSASTTASPGVPSAWAPPREEKLGWWSPNASKQQPASDDIESATETEPDRAPVVTQTAEPVTVAGVETQDRPAWTGKPDAWATPARVPEPMSTSVASAPPRPPVHAPDSQDHRALPAEKRSAHPDFLMLLAGAAAVAVAAIAWQAVAEPWVELQITDTSVRDDPVFVGDMIIRGKGAIIGTIAYALAGVIGALGVMWFLFGFDKGWAMPWLAGPAAGVIAAVAGLAAAVLSTMLWFVWEEAAVQRSRAVGMTPEKLEELLNTQPAPLVEIVRQPGLVRFGLMMGLALVAACVAMAAANKRG